VGPYITLDGKKKRTFIIAFLDDCSRLIAHCEVFFLDNLNSLLTVFKKAVAKRGVPKKIFVDNGKVFKSDQMQFICASLGTILCFAEPYSPQSKGKIERWFGTLKRQWMAVLDGATFGSVDDLNASLSGYVERYNNQYHSSIKKKPLDKFLEHAASLKFVSSQRELDFTFLFRVERVVKNDATISLNNELYQVPMQYIGQRIHVRYDPTDKTKAYIFSHDGKCLDTVSVVKKIDNASVRRLQNIKPVDFNPFSVLQPKEE
jgi:transposase InsO family protein